MRYVKQIGIILGITLAGEILNHVVPLPVPAGVYGLFIMLAALMCGAVKLESVEGTGNFLMDTMTMMFIPATVWDCGMHRRGEGSSGALSDNHRNIHPSGHGSDRMHGPVGHGQKTQRGGAVT